MTFAVPVHQARRHLGELLNQAFYKGRPFILTRGKQPMAVLLGAQEFSQILKLIEKHDPGLADTLAILADPQLQAILEESGRDIAAGRTVPIEELLND
jgi:prevent-host-death family protein